MLEIAGDNSAERAKMDFAAGKKYIPNQPLPQIRRNGPKGGQSWAYPGTDAGSQAAYASLSGHLLSSMIHSIKFIGLGKCQEKPTINKSKATAIPASISL